MGTTAFELNLTNGSSADRTYLPAAMRAAAIAVVLLAVLVLLVLF